MDMMKAIGAMQDPAGYVSQQMFQTMIQQHPNEWNQCKQMFGGKSRAEQVKGLRKLYKERGMDLDAEARKYGIAL